jgi:hypothetical protein
MICNDLLRNHKTANCQDVVQDLLTSHKAKGCNRILKSHFLESQLDFSPENRGKVSDVTVNKFTETLCGYGKAAPRQVDLQYFGRLLLDTGEGCI